MINALLCRVGIIYIYIYHFLLEKHSRDCRVCGFSPILPPFMTMFNFFFFSIANSDIAPCQGITYNSFIFAASFLLFFFCPLYIFVNNFSLLLSSFFNRILSYIAYFRLPCLSSTPILSLAPPSTFLPPTPYFFSEIS